MDDPSGLWRRLRPELRDRIDAELRQRRLASAAIVLRDQAGLEAKPGLYEAQDLVALRLRWLAAHGEVEPEPIVGDAELLAKARSIPAVVVAIEALWDGDSRGWFVELLAIIEAPGANHERFDEVTLAQLRRGNDLRLFNGQVPPWPEAVEAIERGHALATALAVPFSFASPSVPDDRSSRWWDTRESKGGPADAGPPRS